MKYLIKSLTILYLLTIASNCFAQTQGNNWADEVLVYIVFDLFILILVIALVKLICLSARLSKYY
jgi:hypothetical protein